MATATRVAEGIYRIDIGRKKTTVAGDFLRYSLVFLIVDDGGRLLSTPAPP